MKNIRIGKRFILFLTVGLLLVVSGCYSKYVSLSFRPHHGAIWNNGKTYVAFVASKCVYRAAKGIASFPDGGIPNYLVKSTGLYLLDIRNMSLTQLADFDDLTDWKSSFSSSWTVEMLFTDSFIYYRVSPRTSWDDYSKMERSDKDMNRLVALKEKYDLTYSYDLNTNIIHISDPRVLSALIEKNGNSTKADLTGLNKILKQIPLEKWGLNIKEIYPKTDEAYVEETIYLYNKSPSARRAVVEQIIAKMDKSEIRALLKKMEDYEDSLGEYKKQSIGSFQKIHIS